MDAKTQQLDYKGAVCVPAPPPLKAVETRYLNIHDAMLELNTQILAAKTKYKPHQPTLHLEEAVDYASDLYMELLDYWKRYGYMVNADSGKFIDMLKNVFQTEYIQEEEEIQTD